MSETEAFWEDLYTTRAEGAPIWSGRVNAELAREVADLRPGRALDLGCGEGGDAIHLARQGWRVVAVDVSPTALARAAAAAADSGVADRIDFERHDLGDSFPAGDFDLVTAAFLQSPLELDKAGVLRRSLAALAPGGRLVLVEHGAAPDWSEHQHVQFPTPEEVVAELDLDTLAAAYDVLVCEGRTREASSPDGHHHGRLLDTVVVVRRHP
jgi:SAM-dependent methyltransferase